MKRLESEHHRNLGTNAVLALVPGFGWAELSVSRSSTTITERRETGASEHDLSLVFNAFSALKTGQESAELAVSRSSTTITLIVTTMSCVSLNGSQHNIICLPLFYQKPPATYNIRAIFLEKTLFCC